MWNYFSAMYKLMISVKKITIVPIALSNQTSVLDFFMSKNDMHWAGAHNSIGFNTSFTGGIMKDFITSKQGSFRGEDVVKTIKIPTPPHIKIDVDGLEGDVIQGLGTILCEVQFILVDVDESNTDLNTKVKNLVEKKIFKGYYR